MGKVWNGLRADWDEVEGEDLTDPWEDDSLEDDDLDDEIDGCEVLFPEQQIADYEGEDEDE